MEEQPIAGPQQGPAAIGNWWEALQLPMPSTTQEYLGRLFGLSQSYAEFAQRFADTKETTTALEQWLSDLERLWRAAAENPGAPPDQALQGTLAMWNLPLDAWQRAATAVLPFPGDPLRESKLEGTQRLGAGLAEHADRFLAIPAVGYTREYQEQHQQYARQVLRYFSGLQDYQRAMAALGLRSLERFRQRLSEPAQEPPIESLRALYDLWIDVSEAAYTEYAKSAEHSQLYGRLVNGLIAMKREATVLMDNLLDGMNLPTRRELDVIHRRLHETRRESRALRGELEHLRQRPIAPRARTPVRAATRGRSKAKSKPH